MAGVGLADGLATGGQAIGAGIGSWSIYRLVVFACNFLAGRHDARQARLEALELRLTASLGDRLSHLERAERENQARIQMLEGWVAMLATELRMQDPANPKLKELADALRGVTPIVASDPRLDELMRHAGNAVDNERRGRKK